MTTKFQPKNSSPKKSPYRHSLQEVQKKSLQNKKLLSLQSHFIIHNKTYDTLQVPLIDFSTLSNPKTQKINSIISSRSSGQQLSPQKSRGFFRKIGEINTQRPKTISRCENADQRKYIPTWRDFMISESIGWKKVDERLHKLSSSMSVKTVSSNFLESFRVVLNELIESYFVGVVLKKKIGHLKVEIWNYILKKAGLQIVGQKRKLVYHQIDKATFSSGLNKIFKDQFRPNQVSYMVAKYFTYDSIVFYSQLEQILSFQKDFSEEVVEMVYEKNYNSLSPSEMVKLFLKMLIQYADLQKKLQLICGANQYQMIKCLYSINEGDMLEAQKLAEFLDCGGRSTPLSLKISQRKVVNFLGKVLRQKLTKFQLIKWLKLHQKLLH